MPQELHELRGRNAELRLDNSMQKKKIKVLETEIRELKSGATKSEKYMKNDQERIKNLER